MSNSEVNEHLNEGRNITKNDTNLFIMENIESTEAGRSLSAPTELLAEFLSCVMTKDYEKALNFCTQILSYEPNNSTALEFYPLIVEKLEMTLEETSSESSETCSSTSSSSDKSLFHNETLRISSSGTIKSNSTFECDKIKDICGSNLIPLERKLITGNTEIIKPDNLNLMQKTKVKSSTKKIIKKKTQSNALVPLNLIQENEKITLKRDKELHSEVQAFTMQKQENQKAKKKAIISQQSPKVLLHMTKTQKFPKSPPKSKN